jgi:Zn/Cd-binding protein ZinT
MDKLKELESQYDKGYEPNFDRINILKKNIVALENKVKEVSKNREDFDK